MLMEDDQPSSLVCVSASELFPKKSLQSDDKTLQVNFPELCGESVEYLAATSDATIALSNYRLFINFKNSFLNVPLKLLESVELRDLFILQINCKDARSFRIVFDSNEQSAEWLHKLSAQIQPYQQVEELFSFAYYAWAMDAKQTNGYCCESKSSCQRDGSQMPQYSFLDEVHRMGFDTDMESSPWRITDVNSSYEVCRTYPKLHMIPASVKDMELRKVASFRCSGRFPSVVWRHRTNGAVIARCSQPEVGWFVWRNQQDEMLIQAIGDACAKDPGAVDKKVVPNSVHVNGLNDRRSAPYSETSKMKQVLIVDARSYTAAYANRGKGGGFEYTEYYPNCEVMFMNLANIHAIRKSFHSLRTLCSGSQELPNWWSLLEKTNWLHHTSMLIKAAMTVVHSINNDGRPVVVHCSDGWDRTTQVVALAQLLLDPYYRTIEGFTILIEREWLAFGHRFADRCGHGPSMDENERCPVFLQWLDCVHQLLKQFPCSFEFNESFLAKLVQHTYSCLYGTFLGNNEQERHHHNIKGRTLSVWSYLLPRKMQYKNMLYSPGGELVLEPSYHARNLKLWSAVYLAYPTPFKGKPISYCTDEPANSTTPTSPRFPYSDTNLELKSSLVMTPVSCSKSDGELTSCGRNCLNSCNENRSLGNITKDENRSLGNITKDTMDSRNGVCCHCRSSPINGSVFSNGCTADIGTKSLYYSMESPDKIRGDLDTSMSSSTATVVFNESDSTNGIPVGSTNGIPVDDSASGIPVDSTHGIPGDLSSGLSGNEVLSNGESEEDSRASEVELSAGPSHLDASSYEDLTPHCSEQDNYKHNDTRDAGHDTRDAGHDTWDAGHDTRDAGHDTRDMNEELLGKDTSSALTCDTSSETNTSNGVDTQTSEHVSSIEDNVNATSAGATRTSAHPSMASDTGDTGVNTGNASDTGTQTSAMDVRTAINSSAATQTSDSVTSTLQQPNLSSIHARYLDSDGLTSVPDPIQSRLRQIEMVYNAQLEALHTQLMEERRRRLMMNGDNGYSPGPPRDPADEVCSLPDSTQSGEQPCLSCGSADETSWIQIDDSEAEPVRWVPDHAATNCTNCETGFWVANRKHHCRNCGQVFCSSCSDHKLPVPNEQLYDPVRVCVTCFGKLVSMETRENGGRRRNQDINSLPG